MKHLLILCLLLGLGIIAKAQTKPDQITGTWLTEEKDGKVQIYKENGKYFGKLIWGDKPETLDEENPDEKLRKRKVIGIILLKDLVFDGTDTWENGKIYDPQNGKSYSCKLTMEGMNQLNLRGFIGNPLFGRTSTWTRTK